MTIQLRPLRCLAVLLPLAAVLFAAGAVKTEKVQRYGAVIGVKPEKLEYYKRLHANPWPAVNKAIKEANIRNYSIYLTRLDDGEWYLFGYFEYTGSDFDADMKKMGEDSEIKRWWKETDACQIPLDSRKKGEWWKSMEEVYHLD
jgi:L-rhamnose mutarotase